MTITAYFTFNGNAREAMEFYRSIFGGEFVSDQSFGDSPMEVPEEHKDKVMHIHYDFHGCTLMASDAMPGRDATMGSNISLSFNLQDPADVDKYCNALAEGGTITMAPEDTFWGARFAMCTDRFGIHWMFNCDIKK